MEKTNPNNNPAAGSFTVAVFSVAGIIAAGVVIQFLAGPLDIRLLAFPANLLVVALMVCVAVLINVYSGSPLSRWISGVPFSAALIGGFVATGLVMGLIPQSSHLEIAASPFPEGMHSVTSSWPFALLYFTVLLVLACVVIRRALNFKWKDFPFYLNHAGLFLLLAAAGFGAADREKYQLTAYRDKVYSTAYSYSAGHPRPLPFTVRLDRFDIDYYPARLFLEVRQPGAGEKYFYADCTDTDPVVFNGAVRLTVLEYLPNAGVGVEFYPADSTTGNSAALLRLEDLRSGEVAREWVSAGIDKLHTVFSFGNYRLTMLDPEPKRYYSGITIDNGLGDARQAIIEVNKPLRYGHWRVYQYGYDQSAGPLSAYSVLLLVADPWINLAYAGMALLAAGSVCMVWTGRGKRKKVTKR
ncbi:MAG: cytochrome c biogenesis protein ResB [Alistipes sp.]|nr:cytochrome c biogenesis protein ResB [Alistipes sp.]